MNEGWRQVCLGEVLSLDNKKLGFHTAEPEVLSLSKHDGFVPAVDYHDRRIASASLDGYKVIEPNGWAYSTIHIDEGSIARNTLGVAGVISPMYTTLDWVSEEHDPAFFAYLLRSDALINIYRTHAQGSINRRRSLSYKAFAAIGVCVPPLAVQRRIVDMMEHLDNQTKLVKAEETTSVRAYQAVLSHALRFDSETEERPLAQVLSLDIERHAVDPAHTYPMVGVANRGQGVFHSGEVQGTETKYAHLNRLRAGQVVMRKLTAWEGPIAVVPPHADGRYASTEFPTFTIDQEVADIAFLGHLCRWPGLWQRMKSRVTGTVQRRKRLNPDQLLSVEVPLPSLARQQETATLLSSLHDVREALAAESAALNLLRQALLGPLLAGDISVPDTYDELLGVAS